MDLPLSEEVQAQLAAFKKVLASLEGKLQPFTRPESSASLSQLAPLERAQAHLALAQATAALFELYLRASGVDPADHESRKEQERLKQYSKKVRKATAEKELRESRRSLEVNVAAVNRFISAAVPDLSRDQKAALRQAGQQAAASKAAAAAAGNAGGGGGASARKRKQAGGGVGEGEAAGEEIEGEEAAGAAAAVLESTMAELQQGQGLQGDKSPAAGAGQSLGGSGQKKRKKGGARK